MISAFFDMKRPVHRVRLGLTLAVMACLLQLLTSGSVLAANEPHPYAQVSFGPSSGTKFSNPNGIAVDEATGDVYVADIGTNDVYKFDGNGNPVNFTALGSNVLPGPSGGPFSFASETGTPAAVAVDNACARQIPVLTGKACEEMDPSAGDLYVADAGRDAVDKFTSDGEYLGQVSGHFSGKSLLGLGLQGNGDLRVYVSSGLPSSQEIQLFDNAKANAFVTALTWYKHLGNPVAGDGFAVAPNGDMYLLAHELEGLPCDCMEKGGGYAEPLGRVDNGPDVAAAVDPTSGHLFVDEQSTIAEWDTGAMNGLSIDFGSFPPIVSSGTLVSSFGGEQLEGNSSVQGGIAVNGETGAIYVANPEKGEVDLFETDVPRAGSGGTSDATQTAITIHGTVDPGGTAITRCEFEYEAVTGHDAEGNLVLPVASYNKSLPCKQTVGEIGDGSTPVPVSAEIGGLQPAQLYDFRLVAENASGESFAQGRFATTGLGFGIKDFGVSLLNEDGTPDTQAGSHPYQMVTSIALNTQVLPREREADSRYATLPDGHVRDIVTDLPPGLVGDPNATAKKCKLSELEAKKCPPESKVGKLEAEFGEYSYFETLHENVYNMVPPPGVAVQLGALFISPDVFINAGVEAGGDYPVRASSLKIPQEEPTIAVRLTVEGIVGSGESRKAFLTLPTGCTGPLRSHVEADSYEKPGVFTEKSAVTTDSAGQPLALSGCSHLAFPPTISVTPDTRNASTSSGLTVGVHISQKGALNPEGLAESALRDTAVTLPEGVTLNPAGADGLEACTSDQGALSEAQEDEGIFGTPGDQIGFKGMNELNPQYEAKVQWSTFSPKKPDPLLPGVNFCPNGSKIGTVKIRTPLLEHELEGAVYLAAQNANPFGSLVAMYLVAEDPASGSLIKLAGEVKLSDRGQIVTTFHNTPDLPFEDLEVHFFGGERAPLSTPSRCGTYTTRAVFVPWDGNGPVEPTSSFVIDHGPGGGPCPGANLPFNPSLTAGTTSLQAGGFSPFTMTMSREDGNQDLQSIGLTMPPGLSGVLTGVELCPEVQANAGTCGPNSLIGETTVSVGVGNDPFTVKGGRVYLTGSYKGAPFGLSIVNPAKAGPYDVEKDTANPSYDAGCDCVVVRAKIEVDPLTAALTITSDNEGPHKIPTILDGIPLQIKHINVTIDRPAFTFNPTNCDKLAIGADLHGSEGTTSALSVPFQATNCARLSFKPRLKASTSGRTSRKNGASLHVRLVYPKLPLGSQANIHSVKVQLPKQLPSRLETLNQACIDRVFVQNPAACPAASRVGYAKAVTPVLPVPLTGPAYFVSHGGAKFPELVVVLQGYGVTVELHGETFISKGITTSTFGTVPDVPVGTFELTLPQRRHSALAANSNLCYHTVIRHRHAHGHATTVNKKVLRKLVLPTTFTAQNGMVMRKAIPITVTGCTSGKPHRKHGKHKVHRKK